MRLPHCVLACSALLSATWTASASAQSGSASNTSSSVAAGIESLNFGVGCNASTEYPTPNNVSSAEPRFSFVISNPLAQFIALHFNKFNLPKNDYVQIRAANSSDKASVMLKYTGNETSGAFYATALMTSAVVVELFTDESDWGWDTEVTNPFLCTGFSVDSYRFLAQPAGMSEDGAQEEVCGADNSREASCYKGYPDFFKASNAVARLLIHKPEGSFFCTGWLIGCEGHLITNHHCISSQAHASTTEYEFQSQGDSCGTSCAEPLACPGTVRALTAKFIIANEALDYAIVKLPDNLSSEYGYLRLREQGASMSERIYIPQHPSGWGKRIAMKTDSGWGVVESLTRGGCAVDQVAYSLDSRGGSSGSPVIAWADNAVVALHHCGGCPNTGINSNKLVAHMRANKILPNCAV